MSGVDGKEGEAISRREWIAPRKAVAKVAEALSISREAAIAAIVRRLISKQVVSIYGNYIGPEDKQLCFYPQFAPMPIWCGVWTTDHFRAPDSPIWTTGDNEGFIGTEAFYIFNIVFKASDLNNMIEQCSGDAIDDTTTSLNGPPVERAADLSPRAALGAKPKWAWEDAWAELVGIANGIDGLEAIDGFQGPDAFAAQAKIAAWFAEYFSARHPHGEHPVDSECRRRAKLLLGSLTG